MFLYFDGVEIPKTFSGKFPKNHVVVYFNVNRVAHPRCPILYSTWFPGNARARFDIRETNKRFQKRMKHQKEFYDWIGF